MNWFSFSIGLCLVVAAFASGYKVASWRYDAAKVEQLQADLDATIADRDAVMRERDLADTARAQSDAALLDLQEKQRADNVLRKSLVPRVVADNRACDFGAGAIGLLNNAIRGEPMPGATGDSARSGKEVSADSWYDPAAALRP